MISPQHHEPSLGEIMNSTMQKWYDEIDNCLSVSEVVPNHYESDNAPSYQNVCPIPHLGSTRVNIRCQRYYVTSVENSYILLEQKVPISIPNQNTLSRNFDYYVGYLHSAAAIGQYRIYSETDPPVLSRDHAHYEWIMLYNSYSDEAKNNNEHFATLKKIREMNPNVPGTYINIENLVKSGEGSTLVEVTLSLKIPLKAFLLFTNLKWIPNWMGTLVLEIYPTFQNIVVAPVLEEAFLQTPYIEVDASEVTANDLPNIKKMKLSRPQ